MTKRKSSYSSGKKKSKDARKEAYQKSTTTKSPRQGGSGSNSKSLSLQPTQSSECSPVVEDDDGGLLLAATILLTLPTNIWWHILQDNDGDLDISTGSRQDWSLILPVFIESRPDSKRQKIQWQNSIGAGEQKQEGGETNEALSCFY